MTTVCYIGTDPQDAVWFQRYSSGWREHRQHVTYGDRVYIDGVRVPAARFRRTVPDEVYAYVPAQCAGCGTAMNSSGWRLHLPTLTLWCFRIKDCRRQAHLHIYPDCTDTAHTGYDYDLHDPADAAVWRPGERKGLARHSRVLKITRWLDGEDLI